ncbi:hypothetical protein R4P64_25060 [Rhodococcus sp. IEGM 1366]|uniref:hypothetical protein n=1 Tax=Rhodococcus sp. IEGM 1366 TaxID=3082223 RepID=UPI00295565CD|nr:hypothetical protein [Rhodococcus sp. IEGM 1366]MDV8069807.1 hypothetical protein [Rhodococcus sp. IEGM 1366]
MKAKSRTVLWLAFGAFAIAWTWVAATAGDEIPGHFDASGAVTRWDSKWSFLGPIGGICLGLTLAFGSARFLIPRVPGHAISIANHRYWTDPVNRAEFDRRISEDLEWLGAATALLLAWIAAVAGTSTDGSVDTWLLVAPTVLYLVGVLGYCAYMIWGGRYRVPQQQMPQ